MEWKYKYKHQQYIGRSKNHGHRRNCLEEHQRLRVEVERSHQREGRRRIKRGWFLKNPE